MYGRKVQSVDMPDLSDLRCTESFDVDRHPLTPQIMMHDRHQPAEVVSAPPVMGFRDPALVRDDRVIQNMLRLEKKSLPSAPDYFRFVQTRDITPAMRKMVAEWMLQVCQELECQPEVFSMAMNYFDRFLACCRVRKSSLQLIGSVCLLVASKFKETNPILGERLIFYSDFSIGSEEIKVNN